MYSKFRPRGVPDIAKQTRRRCHFDEVASPKYGNHHYMYDRKYNQVAANSKAGLIPFEKLGGFSKAKQERKVHPTPAVVQRNLHPIMHKPQKSAMAGSIEDNDVIGPPKLVTQKDGFPYDKYNSKF